MEENEVAPKRVASQLGLASSTVSYHLDRLEDSGLVTNAYGSDGKMKLSVSDPGRVEELLLATDPDMLERLTDHFERLVDGLLD